jgi:uncharacterized protein involved in tolerance to divalent cations
MKKFLLLITILICTNCFAREEYKYAGVIWEEKIREPIVFRILFKTKDECEKEIKKIIAINKKVSKLKQYFVCSPVFVGNK